MKTTIDQNDFIQAFSDYNRSDNFSYGGLQALFEYFEDLEADIPEGIELDVIAICCEFSEYENIEEFHQNYDKSEYPDIETIQDYTTVIEISGSDSFIIADF